MPGPFKALESLSADIHECSVEIRWRGCKAMVSFEHEEIEDSSTVSGERGCAEVEAAGSNAILLASFASNSRHPRIYLIAGARMIIANAPPPGRRTRASGPSSPGSARPRSTPGLRRSVTCDSR